jgi:hypothetical protein
MHRQSAGATAIARAMSCSRGAVYKVLVAEAGNKQRGPVPAQNLVPNEAAIASTADR